MSLVTDAHRALLPDTGAGPGDTTRTALAAGVRRGMATAAVHDASGREPAGGERLAALASRVTRELAALGVREGDVVALHAARTAALVPLLVGILERGAAFVLLDPAHPPARLRAQLAAVAPVLLIRFEEAGALPKAITDSGVRVVEAGRLLGALDVLDAPTPAPSAPGAEHPAYIMFTSGSTGPLPRGVRSGPAPWLTSSTGTSRPSASVRTAVSRCWPDSATIRCCAMSSPRCGREANSTYPTPSSSRTRCRSCTGWRSAGSRSSTSPRRSPVCWRSPPGRPGCGCRTYA